MARGADFVTTEQAAATLGVTAQHVRRLIDAGHLTRVARGLVDATSLDRYQSSARGGRTRVWAEHTAWAAVALLSGVHPDWLGSAQTSRLRGVLGEIDALDLVARTNLRSAVHVYRAHPAAVARLAGDLVSTDPTSLGLVHSVSRPASPTGPVGRDLAIGADGYYPIERLDEAVRSYALREEPTGNLVVRATGLDLVIVRALAATTVPVLTALDAATALDPRERGTGLAALESALEAYRL